MKRRFLWWVVIAGLLLSALWVWNHRFGQPDDFADMAAQYKYGSTGSDHPLARAPLPYWLWKVLPEVYPPYQVMPRTVAPKNEIKGYGAFGLVSEASMERPVGMAEDQAPLERPIGFSKRRVFGIDLVGVNCAFCHLSTVRKDATQAPQVVLGGTGNAVDIEQYFLFLFAALDGKNLDADKVMSAVIKEANRQNRPLGWVDRLLYRYILIPLIPRVLAKIEIDNFDFIAVNSATRLPDFGPGRVDTWSLYKRIFVEPPQRDPIPGIVDFPSIWNQKARAGMRMHWDGNTDILEERNIVSALAVIGKNIGYLDYARLTRTTDWIFGLLPPRYVDRIGPVRQDLVARGAPLFREHCAECHASDGLRIGRVEPLQDLGTNPTRLQDFTPELAAGLNRLGTDEWKLRNFKLQDGYVNTLLDGIWLRAPYLHNGSVPTLRDLLNEPELRPRRFCRGNDLFDSQNVGYVSTGLPGKAELDCGVYFLYDTQEEHGGNGNGGHLYGTGLSAEDKDALIEFLKTQ